MIVDVKDIALADNTKLYRYEKVLPDGTGTGEYVYLKYAPDALVTEPTPINRNLLMAMQGFTACTTTFLANGNIQEVGTTGTKLTEFLANGNIRETFTNTSGQSITKTTVFNQDGSIEESIS